VTQRAPIPPEFYEARANKHRASWESLGRRSRLLSNLRGLTFAVWVLSWGFALFGSAGRVGVFLGSTALLAFIALILYHSRVIEREAVEARWIAVNEDAQARVSGNAWHKLASKGEQFRSEGHPYADDLDLFGRASLFQRLSVAKTHLGEARLANFLMQPSSVSEVLARQELVRELAPQLDLRQEIEVLARATLAAEKRGDKEALPTDLEPLFKWAETDQRLANQKLLSWLAWGLPGVTTLALALAYLHVVPAELAFIALLSHLYVLFSIRRARAEVSRMLATCEAAVLGIEPLFRLLEKDPPDGILRSSLDRELKSENARPSEACRSLRKIAGWFEMRHNGLIYPFINWYALWDLHCTLAFDAWRRQNGTMLRRWFALIGELEALSSLAGYYYDEPETCLAELVEDEVTFSADALGHPLLPATQRVANDVCTLQAGHGLLVTGSNMSGKSTFLRAIGVGAVLALAGGPVCAKRLRISPMSIATSMRISDSLASGVSHFYAELRKLKAVVGSADGKQPVLFLLDEILHGTNSRERQIGARWILAQLLHKNALGAVSTHDIELCELKGELADRLTLVHFRENVANDEMTFDYLLRQGPVTAGNALRLMRSLGLEVPLDGQ
jgi:hypothetical protein